MNGTEIRGILAKNIKFFRDNRHWSQADLAANSEISVPFLSEIERGNKWPFPDTLGKIASALNVQIHDLFRQKEMSTNAEKEYSKIVAREILVAQKVAVERVTKQYLGKVITF